MMDERMLAALQACMQHRRFSKTKQTQRAPAFTLMLAGRLALRTLQLRGLCGSLGLKESLLKAACACCQLTRSYADISDAQFMQETGLPVAERCKVTERNVHMAACFSARCLKLWTRNAGNSAGKLAWANDHHACTAWQRE